MSSIVFTEDRPHEASFVVYFNGIEIPCEGIDVNMAVNTIPTADVHVAPDRELQRLGAEDRVQVAAFYLDDIYTELTGTDPDFRLLYEGDIVGWSYSNTASGRSMSFRTINFLDILNKLYVSFITGLDSMVTQQVKGNRTPETVPSAQYGPTFPASILYQGLDSNAPKAIRRPYDMIENALRAAVGSLEQHKLGSVVSTNFFARYVKKVGLLDRFVPSPIIEIDHMRLSDDDDPEGVFPILRYVRQQDTLNLFKKHMDQLAGGSMLGLITDTFQRMYYEYLAITTAPVAQVNFSAGGVRGEILGPPQYPATPAKPNRILNYTTKPQWRYGIPPSCNVFFPSMIQSLTFEEDYLSQPTRLYMNNDWLVNTFQAGGKLPEFMVPASGYPRQVQLELNKRAGFRRQGNLSVSGKNLLVWPEEYFKGPVTREETLPPWFMMLLQNANTEQRDAFLNPKYESDPMLLDLGYSVNPEDGTLVKGATDPIQQSFFTLDENTTPTQQELTEARKQKMEWLQQLYAREEYYRQRSAYRNAAVRGPFNPYVIPGFPSFVFDELATGNHIVAYTVAVNHSLRTTGFSTTVSMTHAQTLDEYMHQISNDRLGNNPESRKYIVNAAPASPIPELRFVTQTPEMADGYFTTLLHRKEVYKGAQVKTGAFDFTKAIQLVLPSGEKASVNFQDTTLPTKLSQYTNVVPSSAYENMFSQFQSAMAFVSRPVCTLEEYINFQERGLRAGKVVPGNDPRQGKGAVFYERILALVQGPEEPPTLDENNYPTEPISVDTRADWQQRLINYRTKILYQLHPQEA